MYIRPVTVKAPSEGRAFKLWPLEGASKPGNWVVTVVNTSTTAAVSVVDNASKTLASEGVEIPAGHERQFGPMEADALWAVPVSGEPTVVVIASSFLPGV